MGTPHAGRGPETNRLESVERAMEEMTAPEGIDLTELVDGAVERFWAHRGEPLESSVQVRRESAAVLRGLAGWLQGSHPSANALRNEFLLDAAFAFTPVALALLSLVIPPVFGRAPSAWTPVAGVSVSVLGLLWLLLLLLRGRRGDVSWQVAVRHSAGAMFAGLVMAAFLGSFFFSQQRQRIDLSADFVESKLQAVALSELAALHSHRAIAYQSLIQAKSVRIHRLASSPDGPKYKADAPSLPGSLVAFLDEEDWQGKVVWLQGNKELPRDSLALGCIDEVTSRELSLESFSGNHLDLRLEDPHSVIELSSGDCVGVAFDPQTLVTSTIKTLAAKVAPQKEDPSSSEAGEAATSETDFPNTAG